MKPPMDVLEAIVEAGGRPLFVGGCVRDHILALTPKDWDVEVYGLSVERLESVLSQHGTVNIVGKQFAVLKLRVGDHEFDFSLPRKDSHHGDKHNDLTVIVDPHLSLEDASKRRDFTINSMAMDINGTIYDPHNGNDDITNGVLRATSSAFVEDVLRPLRGMKFAARFDMVGDFDTLKTCRQMVSRFDQLPVDRIYNEFLSLCLKGKKISKGLQFLKSSGWSSCFPELHTLIGCEQDQIWHPEGDVYTHTGLVADAAVFIAETEQLGPEDRLVLVLSALCHDFGKPETTIIKDGRIRSPGHANVGVPKTISFLKRIGMGPDIIEQVVPLVKYHMAHIQANVNPTFVRRLSVKVAPSNVRQLVRLIKADYMGRPPLERIPEECLAIDELALTLKVSEEKPAPIVMGRHLLALGRKPGPELGQELAELYQRQLDGEFSTVEEGLQLLS